jgi:hypothetical protein
MADGPPRTDRPLSVDPNEAPAALKRDQRAMEEILALLSAEQQATWQNMIGAHFDFHRRGRAGNPPPEN